jgi:hypothetical protein
MNNPDQHADVPVPADLAAIAAFLDGEPVDAVALKDALARDAGREYLVDLLRLRDAVPHAWPPVVVAGPSPRYASLRWWAAAAVVLIASAVGYAAGQRAQVAADNQGAGGSVIAVLEAGPAAAPEPTHVIRLEPGVTWHVEGAR